MSILTEYPAADLSIDHIADLMKFDRSEFLRARD